jgi:hypothetical protein
VRGYGLGAGTESNGLIVIGGFSLA